MKHVLALVVALLPLSVGLFAQQKSDDPVVMEVAGQQIHKSEFMKEFLPTVGKQVGDAPTQCTYEKRKALEDYVNLYANFRAKVADAKALGYDTAPSLEYELRRYRKDLAAPYLIDSATLVALMQEAYDRNQYTLHASHILVPIGPDASPEDTLKAYKHALELRQRVLNGENFNAIAREEVNSHLRVYEEPSNRENEGDIGYFTAFDNVYPFESAAYNLQVGEISMPVRTRFGYHIVRLNDRLKYYGKSQMRHIWLRSADPSMRKAEIELLYQRLLNGEPFEIVAQRSDEKTTSSNGGLMPELNANQMLPEYLHQVAMLNVGDISMPFRTPYGWHIIKVEKKDSLPPYENMLPYYKQRMTRDQRGSASRKIFAEKSREKYGIIDYTVTPKPTKKVSRRSKKNTAQPVEMMASLSELIEKIPDSIMKGKWHYFDTVFTDTMVLVYTPSKNYGVKDVANYIYHKMKQESRTSMEYYIRQRYNDFLDSVSIVYASSQLENDYPEFAQLMDEYRRGLMIFNYCDKMIWSKAREDSVGLERFYEQTSGKKDMSNEDDSLFFWKKRARIVDITVLDCAYISVEKARKVAQKGLKKGFSTAQFREALAKNIGKKYRQNNCLDIVVDYVEDGHQNIITDKQWNKDVYVLPQQKGYKLLVVQQVYEPCLKTLLEARGYYLNDYQDEVERQLNEQLRKKYNVKIYWDVVDEITY